MQHCKFTAAGSQDVICANIQLVATIQLEHEQHNFSDSQLPLCNLLCPTKAVSNALSSKSSLALSVLEISTS